MKISFKYKSIKYVIRDTDFIEQISKYYKKQYFMRNVDMGEYVANILVSDNNIKKINYVGEELVYYSILYKNGMQTTKSKDEIINGKDFLQAKIIENNLIVLEMPHYNYLSIISGYSVYTQEKTITIDLENNANILINKLQKIFRQEIIGIINCIDERVSERVYNGDIEYIVNGKKYSSTDRLTYKSCGYKYVYIPDMKKILIINYWHKK